MSEEEIREFLSRLKIKDPEVKKVQFPELVPPPLDFERLKIGFDYLEEIIVTVEARLGQATLKIKDILGLKEGFVIELDKVAGETVDVLVNHQRFGRGEVVIIGNNFGVRIDSICEAEKT